MPKGKCVFNKALMENDKYKLLLKPGKTIYHAKCSICGSEFSVDWGCESAVKSHERGSSHTKNIRDLESAKKGLAHLFFEKYQHILMQRVLQLLLLVKTQLLLLLLQLNLLRLTSLSLNKHLSQGQR